MPNVFLLALRRLRGPLITLVCVYAAAVLGLVLIPGVDGYGNPWRMDFFHAFYFVSFTGSTIGFGELPYPFTDAQRIWVLVCIYFSVTTWFYAIGRGIALMQEPAFRHALTHNRFVREVRRINTPFYIVCGYGDTGQLLVQGFAGRRINTVVIDRDQERINELQLVGLSVYVPGLRGDANHPDTLIAAGLNHLWCAGVIAVTNSDQVNLQVAISSKLLSPELPVICRSEIHDVGINMESFGTDHIVNPFDIFADRLATALHSPANYVIREWLTSASGSPLSEPLFPPKGQWILCGYGRFGKAVQRFLSFEGIDATIIESRPKETQAPEDAILGRGTEAVTLREGGVEQAAGIIAGTDDDANNLSIIMTARELNPDLFTVARQNKRENDAIFRAANLHLIMQRSDIIARQIIARITSPILADFLEHLPTEDDEWSNVLASRISGVSAAAAYTWVLRVNKANALALTKAVFSQERNVTLRHILNNSQTTGMNPLALALVREGKPNILPAPDFSLAHGDQILLVGSKRAQRRVELVANNANVLEAVLSDAELSPSSV